MDQEPDELIRRDPEWVTHDAEGVESTDPVPADEDSPTTGRESAVPQGTIWRESQWSKYYCSHLSRQHADNTI